MMTVNADVGEFVNQGAEKLEKELLNFLTTDERPRKPLGIVLQKKHALEFLHTKYYGEAINADASGCLAVREDGKIVLTYSNLYSYMLVCGVNVPYYEWVYDKEYTLITSDAQIVFSYDDTTGLAKRTMYEIADTHLLSPVVKKRTMRPRDPD